MPLACSFSASPSALFIPPAASTNLSWICTGGLGATACTVSKAGGAVLTTGGATGSVPNAPIVSTQYNLNCTNSGTGTTDSKAVSVTVNGLIIKEIPPVRN
jgi:hypothetical protein